MKTVYTAFSKHNFFARNLITAFALEEGVCPLNPFTNWGYFLDDMVERDLIKHANDHFVQIADEIWVFDVISNGVWHEIALAKKHGKPIRFFLVGKKPSDIVEITVNDLVFEQELIDEFGEKKVKNLFSDMAEQNKEEK
jgi:hypothetical protein